MFFVHVQVDSMVRESGEFHMKTDQERQLEKRVKERKQELMEEYRAQKEQRKESKASQLLGEAKQQRSSDAPEEFSTSMDGERNGMEARAGLSHVHDRLYADHQSASRYEREVTSSPGPRRKSGNTRRRALHLILLLKVPHADQNGAAYVCVQEELSSYKSLK